MKTSTVKLSKCQPFMTSWANFSANTKYKTLEICASCKFWACSLMRGSSWTELRSSPTAASVGKMQKRESNLLFRNGKMNHQSIWANLGNKVSQDLCSQVNVKALEQSVIVWKKMENLMIMGQFGTKNNLASRTIWRQDNLSFQCEIGQFGTKGNLAPKWKEDNLAP